MTNYAVVALDATGSMNGQEERVVSSMNEYVAGLPDDTHVSVFMFDTERWESYFEGEKTDWPKMERENYRPGTMTPLYDAVAKILTHADGLASDGDKVMVMVDTDGFENASKEHTQGSVTALVKQKKDAGWAFLFMSAGLDKADAVQHGVAGSAMGMSVQVASVGLRCDSYAHAAGQTTSYYAGGGGPKDWSADDAVKDKKKVEPFFAGV